MEMSQVGFSAHYSSQQVRSPAPFASTVRGSLSLSLSLPALGTAGVRAAA